MKARTAILCSLLLAPIADAQESPARFIARYKMSSSNAACKLEFQIDYTRFDSASLWMNQREYRGKLVRNSYNNGIVYNFYPRINSKRQLLLLVFRNDDSCATMTIANQDYLPLFRPCLDTKYITLQACD